MNKFKGTKGKFTFESGLGHAIIYDDCGIDIFDETDNTKQTVRANALLISKAPEMLEMLKKVLDINIYHNFNGHLINQQIEQLIKEATEL